MPVGDGTKTSTSEANRAHACPPLAPAGFRVPRGRRWQNRVGGGRSCRLRVSAGAVGGAWGGGGGLGRLQARATRLAFARRSAQDDTGHEAAFRIDGNSAERVPCSGGRCD